MPAPSPDLVLARPPALNALKKWPYLVDPFPVALLVGYEGAPTVATPRDDPSTMQPAEPIGRAEPIL